MKTSDFISISFINFYDLTLDYSENYYNQISFTYQQTGYVWYLYYENNEFILEDSMVEGYKVSGKMLTKVRPYTVLRHADFYFTFIKENATEYDNDLSLDTIFSKYKLGILSYESPETLNGTTTTESITDKAKAKVNKLNVNQEAKNA